MGQSVIFSFALMDTSVTSAFDWFSFKLVAKRIAALEGKQPEL
jgi:hypothetical protein